MILITRQKALEILEGHGWGPKDPTEWHHDENHWDPTSTFDQEMGIKDYYDLGEIKKWLGY